MSSAECTINWFRWADSSAPDTLLGAALLLLLAAPPVVLELKSASYRGSFLPTIIKTDILFFVLRGTPEKGENTRKSNKPRR